MGACSAPEHSRGRAASSLPARAGVGFKSVHLADIEASARDVGFFEIHAENYMGAGGIPHAQLMCLRRDSPLSLHGVGLSIGGESALDLHHLDKLAALLDRYAPQSFSEHLAWACHGDVFLNDLLPVPYTLTTLQRVCDHIDQVQAHLKRRMLLENPATYIEFAATTMAEAEFIGEIVRRTGCGLLLDVNNVYVSCTNHNRDPHAYIRALPHMAVGEIHLAGFAREQDGAGDPLLIDTHGAPVAQEVWQLYAYALEHCGPVATLIERDNDIPPFDILFAEARQADDLLAAHEPTTQAREAGR